MSIKYSTCAKRMTLPLFHTISMTPWDSAVGSKRGRRNSYLFKVSLSEVAFSFYEREEAEENLDSIKVRSGKRGRPRRGPKKIAGDKGYDSKQLRKKLR